MAKKIGNLTLFSVDDLHDMLGVSKLTIRAYLREGRLRGRKLGVSWYVTEEAIRQYFEEPHAASDTEKNQPKSGAGVRYIVQGINDLVSETEECNTIPEVLEILQEQAIISLFQVQIINAETGEIKQIMKARDFLEKHAEA